MGAPFIRLVYDIVFVSYFKIKKFCQEEQNEDEDEIHNSA